MDMENRMHQPSAETAEQVAKLRTRLQESERTLGEAEKQIDELETKKESWRQEVSGFVKNKILPNIIKLCWNGIPALRPIIDHNYNLISVGSLSENPIV